MLNYYLFGEILFVNRLDKERTAEKAKAHIQNLQTFPNKYTQHIEMSYFSFYVCQKQQLNSFYL